MAVRPIVKYPDPTLRKPTEAVGSVTDEIRTLVADMAETMFAANGAGLAAIQVGVPLKLFIIDAHVAGGREEDPPLVFINPEIVALSPEAETADEGCLSFPTVFIPIKRALRARVRATGLDGKVFEAEGEGLYGRAIQHEHDHLNGKILADFVGPLKREMIKRKMRRLAKQAEADAEDDGDESER
jgi:peptide deformylase